MTKEFLNQAKTFAKNVNADPIKLIKYIENQQKNIESLEDKIVKLEDENMALRQKNRQLDTGF